MRRDGVPRLSVAGTTVGDLAALFPDQKRQLTRLSGKCGDGMAVTDLFKSLHYNEPAELFTMWACLFADSDVVNIVQGRPKEWLEAQVPALRAALQAYRREHSPNPHPAVLLRHHLDCCA